MVRGGSWGVRSFSGRRRFLKRESAGGFGLTLRLRGGATSPKLVPTQEGTGSVGDDPRGAPRGGESYRGRGDHIGVGGSHRGEEITSGEWGSHREMGDRIGGMTPGERASGRREGITPGEGVSPLAGRLPL